MTNNNDFAGREAQIMKAMHSFMLSIFLKRVMTIIKVHGIIN